MLFTGGEILTMRGAKPEYVESLAVKDGRLLFAGPLADGRTLSGPATKTVDLAGKTLLPGFIDTHGHFVYFGKNLVDANLCGCTDIDDLVARMKKQAERTPADGWIVGFGYQARGLKEGRHPTSADLDRVSADRPVMVVDSSGHLGAANAAAFKAAGITAATPDPTGGQFTRGPDGKSLLGPMEETALNAVRSKRPPFTGELAARAITGAAEVWASHGQTTAMEAGLGLGNDDIGIVVNAIDEKLLPIDLYVAAKDSALDDSLAAAYSVASQYNPKAGGIVEKLRAARPDLDRRYVNRVRLGGVKFWLDGSLDTAADQALAAIAKAVKKHGMHDHRPVFVHATWLRPDQIEKMKACGAIPSFLTAGIIPGGDAVVRLWGPERSAGAMASRTFLRAGMPFTYSHDAPVSPVPSILALVDAGVNRLSGTGKVVGPDERIAPYDALRAVTATAAYQLKEEKTRVFSRICG